jgi:putative hydrolase of the HAD superfamily
MKKTAIVYWLLPAKPERELFCHFVRIFCRELHAPNFDPHLTLFAGSKGRQRPAKVLRQVRSGPIRLNVRNVAFSGKFTKTLYVRFKSMSALKKLSVDLARAANSRAKALRDPHVSLLYARIPRAARREIAAVIKLPFRRVLFDSVAAVRLSLPVRTRADVDKWKIIAKKSLRR